MSIQANTLLSNCCRISLAWIGMAAFFASHTTMAFAQQDFSREATLERFTADLKYLASDDMAGRLPGTPEMEKAVEFIVNDFKKSGLKPAMPDGTYFQTFDVGNTSTIIPEKTKLSLKGPNDASMDLAFDKDFGCQVKTASFKVQGDLVFVGYGITADEHNFDEYKNIDVKGKVVVLIRKEPQQNKENSVFDGVAASNHAAVREKCATAGKNGAAAIIFVNDVVTSPDAQKDELVASDLFGNSTGTIPFFQVKRSVIDDILKKTPLANAQGTKIDSLAAAETAIDDTLESLSQPIKGWSVSGEAEFAKKPILTKNIIGVIEGEGPLANETIVIGGHYDHLGMGAFGSRAGRREIHNGADDNATGTAGIMELVRRFQARDKKPARRLVFICFTAEEMGLLGAAYYVNNPVFPLEKTVAMVNYDMIGWLRDDKLTVYSWDSSPQFGDALDRANAQLNLRLEKPLGGFAGSDHLPFQQRGIPVMFLHTGLTSTYHTPEDDFETINCDGAVKVIDYTEKLIDELASLKERPTFAGPTAGRRVQRIRLGAELEDLDNDKVKIVSFTEDSIGEKSGLKVGDVIMKVGDKAVKRRREVVQAMSANAGKKVKFVVDRDGVETILEIELKE